jgi:hypothetical protein
MARRMLVGRGRSSLVGTSYGDSPEYGHVGADATMGTPVAYAGGSTLSVVERDPGEAREFPIGFIALAVAASATATIQAKPQVLFRAERLMLEPVTTAVNFDLVDVKIGKDSQLAAADFNLFGGAFVPTAVGSRLQCDTAEPGIIMTLIAANTDAGAAHNFKAAFFGSVLD